MENPKGDSAIRDVIRVYGLFQRYMQPHFARFGISGSQWGVLRTLGRLEEEGVETVRLSDLSKRLLIQPPSVTGVIDRLERLGLVTRTTSREDRRARDVALTREGRELVAKVRKGHPERIRRALQGLSEKEQQELKRLLQKLGGWLEGVVTDE